MRWVIWLGWVEGLSAVLLMCIATPVKYLMDAPHMVEILGPIHGGLFMLYLFEFFELNNLHVAMTMVE